jgi:cytochrome c oxidase cbb3-type subunit 3
MKQTLVVLAAFSLIAALITTGACNVPGRPSADSQELAPAAVTNFKKLYASNCAGCHGLDGKTGPALEIGDPEYLAIADDAVIRRVVAKGVPGTAMPAFAQSAGGMLTSAQVDAIVAGIRSKWAKTDVLAGADPPSYALSSSPSPSGGETADAKRGKDVYTVYCSSCHGPDGEGGPHGSSIVDGSYLSLVSDQHLRTTVIIGRPELGAPDWRGDVPGKPMSHEDVSDVVAWLAEQRPQFTTQLNSNRNNGATQ